MTELELIHRFEKYLNGELNSSEKEEFERLIQEDKDIREKFLGHKGFIQKLHGLGHRKKLKSLLQETQRQMDLEKQKKRYFDFEPRYLAIAASVVGVLLLSVSFYFGYLYSGKRTEYSYQETKRNLRKIEAKQDAILRNLHTKSKELQEAELSGTGFLISNKGYLLTNYHLIKDADSVWVYSESQAPVKAVVVSKNHKYDLALLKIDLNKKLSKQLIPYSFRKRSAEPGEQVFTIGFPREDMVYGEGSISSSSGFEGDSLAYQISIPVNPGNSGGPLLDDAGYITGIISGKQTMAEGTGFAVKSSYIQEFLKSSLEKEGVKISNTNSIAWLNRKDKVKKLKPFVFEVKVYQ